MPIGSVRHIITPAFVFGCIAGLFISFFSCKGEGPFPIPTLAEEIASNSPPSMPFNPFPPDGAIDVVRAPVLQWQVDEPDGEELFFDVFFDIDSLFQFVNIIAEELTDTFITLPSDLGSNTTYYWKIDVRDASENWRFGELWTFTTGTELNNEPVVQILAPQDESQFNISEEILFRGTANDVEDGILSGDALIWNSNINGNFGIDSVVVTSSLGAGIHAITFKATDSQDKSVTDKIQITVIDPDAENIPPAATILSPVDEATFGEDEPITFRGAGLDIEDGILSGNSLSWSSSIDGNLGNDTLLVVSDLSKDTHIITLRATDSGGLFREHQIQITVKQIVNTPPLVQILEPANLSSYADDSTITFRGTAFDIEDGALTGAAVTWTSNRDGQFGTGINFTFTGLSLGTHTITMRGEDSEGAQSSDQLAINITPVGEANQPPVASIVQPQNNGVFFEGTLVTLQGNGIDQEDGSIQNSFLSWTSDRDGFLGTGSSLSLSSLTEGKHDITLTVLDSGGKEDSATITIFISSPGNTPPAARITIEQIIPPSDPNTVDITLDASGIYDATDQLSDIEIRWDFDNDGTFDTEFTFEKTTTFSYARKDEPHFVRVFVRDGGGLTDEATFVVPEYVFVPAANFEMGSLSGNPVDEQPRHTVFLDAFYTHRFEVTNWQFAVYLSENPGASGNYYSNQMSITKLEDGSFIADAGFENYPVRYVEWHAANGYAIWADSRLPTEAEWEKAARGGQFLGEGNTIPNILQTRNYPWGTGGVSPNHANYLVTGRPFDGLAPVGIYTGQTINSVQTLNNASPYGVFDMLGNIAEWVSDWYKSDYYSISPPSNPTGPNTGEFKVYRGGSFDHSEVEIRISRRFQAIPTARPYNVGFRTVITP